MREFIEIDGITVARGEKKSFELNVSRLPSGTMIGLSVNVFRSKKPGPVVLLTGGLHGDEVNGIEILRRLIEEKQFNRLKCGSVIVIPILNVFGFLNYSREVPDGKDVNRSFPGNRSGSLASRVAYVISKQILPQIDFGIDFHTGGGRHTNYSQIRVDPRDEDSLHLAEVFSAPFTVHSSFIQRSLRKEAYDQAKPMIVFEGGETLRFNEPVIKAAKEGTLRVLKHHNMITEQVKAANTTVISDSNWVRAKRSGLFRSYINTGDAVEKGEIIGAISDPGNQYSTKVKSKVDGFAIGLNKGPVVNQGDALFHIGTK